MSRKGLHLSNIVLFLLFGCLVTVTADKGDYVKDRNKQEYCEKDGDCTPYSDVRLVRLPGVELGHVEELNLGQRVLNMKTANMKPVVFEIENFLTEEECDHFMTVAKDMGLKESNTQRGPSSSNIRIMDVNDDKELSISEMKLTVEDSFDVFLSDADILDMYKDLNLDKNGDESISQKELMSISPPELADYIQTLAKQKPVKRSRFSKQVWLYPDSSADSIFQNIQNRVQKLTGLPDILIKKSDFQVVRYGTEGHYNAHHDSTPLSEDTPCCTRKSTSNCRICRFMTVLFYLNDVEEGGGTAFPLAGNETYSEHALRSSHRINLQEYCNEAPLVVLPSRGKAVVWYNHEVDETTGWLGELDPFTWHGGCPVIKGEKWIANFWIKTTDDKQTDLKDTSQITV